MKLYEVQIISDYFFSAHKGNAVERKLRLRKRRDGEKESEKVLKVLNSKLSISAKKKRFELVLGKQFTNKVKFLILWL
jgi:hypothetical protein